MIVANYILIGILALVSFVLIVLVMMQSKEDKGVSGAIVQNSVDNFYQKNKGRTKEGKLKRNTVICMVLFFVLVIVLDVIYM